MTIAFSEKYGFWTTRYSFEPTCYFNVDNELLSSKESIDVSTASGVYLHDDPDVERNNFYGEAYNSEITVSSNQDPSAIKFYKSVSVETNAENILATVTTNEEYSGAERQSGYIDSFVNREGFKYAEMPRSAINSTSNISPLPLMFFGYYANVQEQTIYNPFTDAGEYIVIDLVAEKPFPIEIGSEIKVLDAEDNLRNPIWNDPPIGTTEYFDETQPAYVYSTGVHQTGLFEVRVAVKKGSHYYNENGELNNLSTSGLFQNLTSTNNTYAYQYLTSFWGTSSSNGFGPQFGNYNPFLLFQLNQNTNGFPSAAYYAMTPFTNGAGGSVGAFPAFAVSNSTVNGDQMRGPYAKVKLTISDTTPFELHAVNVDYSFSKLDARLTQNS